MEQSCTDLLGVNLTDPASGAPSGQSLDAADCTEVAKALLAVEMRDEPTFCNFTSVLTPGPAPLACATEAFADDFETDPGGTWTLTNADVYAEYTPRDWEWTANVPAGGTGSAFFAVDSVSIGDCSPGSDDQSGVMHLDSPSIVLPPGATPSLTFDHWVATEALFDGANVKISVNGGPFQLIAAADYGFNPYNGTLNDADASNTSPLGGEAAFTGTDGGSAGGSWGQSQADLSS